MFDKVIANFNTCGIEFSFNSIAIPSIVDNWQPFYNSTYEGMDWQKVYTLVSSISFSEESSILNGNTFYIQKLIIKFPEKDRYRAQRIALLNKIKHVKIKFTDRLDLVIGRNDFNQNAFPNIKTSSDSKFCIVEISAKSIFPSGFTPSLNQFGLPTLIPLSF